MNHHGTPALPLNANPTRRLNFRVWSSSYLRVIYCQQTMVEEEGMLVVGRKISIQRAVKIDKTSNALTVIK